MSSIVLCLPFTKYSFANELRDWMRFLIAHGSNGSMCVALFPQHRSVHLDDTTYRNLIEEEARKALLHFPRVSVTLIGLNYSSDIHRATQMALRERILFKHMDLNELRNIAS